MSQVSTGLNSGISINRIPSEFSREKPSPHLFQVLETACIPQLMGLLPLSKLAVKPLQIFLSFLPTSILTFPSLTLTLLSVSLSLIRIPVITMTPPCL